MACWLRRVSSGCGSGLARNVRCLVAFVSLVGVASCSASGDGWTSDERSRFVDACVDAAVYQEGDCNRHRRNYEGLGCTFAQAVEIAGEAYRYEPDRATEDC